VYDKGWLSRMWDSFFSKDKTADYRRKALLCFLPKWSGFLVNETTENMEATGAIVKLYNVVNCLSNVWIRDSSSYQRMQSINFDLRKVIFLTAVYLFFSNQ